MSRASGDGIVAVEGASGNVIGQNKPVGSRGWDISDEDEISDNFWEPNICKTSGGSAGECVKKL